MDVGEGYEYDGDFDLGPGEDIRHKLGEFSAAVDIFGIRCIGRDPTEGKVYGFHRALHDIV